MRIRTKKLIFTGSVGSGQLRTTEAQGIKFKKWV